MCEFANLHTKFNKTLTISASVSRNLSASLQRMPGSLLMEHCERHIRALTCVRPGREGVSQAGLGKTAPFVLYVLPLVLQFGHLPRVDRKEGVQLITRQPVRVSR